MMLRFVFAISLLVSAWPAFAEPGYGLPLQGEEAEAFLRHARVVKMKPIGVGITKPMKVTLSDGVRTHHAVWKSINEVRHGVVRGRNGGFQMYFRDSYKNEIAAYELDKLLSLDLVPPTVERQIRGKKGSLQLWVEGAFTELDRREKQRVANDYASWSRQLYTLRLLQQLTYNDDTRNIRNVIYDPSFRVYSIDNSRSFRHFRSLPDESGLRRFSRSALQKLKELDGEMLEGHLGPWLESDQIEALLVRRDMLVDLAHELAANVGAGVIYYP